jgi:hypothetical protein
MAPKLKKKAKLSKSIKQNKPAKSIKPVLLTPDSRYDWHCLRCGHRWRSRVVGADRPVCCAKCHSCYYDRLPKNGKIVRPVESKRGVRAQVRPQAQQTQKVPVPFVGTAYKVTGAEPIFTQEQTGIVAELARETFGEVYGILPPPPSVAAKLRREQAQAQSPVQSPAPVLVPTKPVSSHVIDPNELTPEDQARLDKLVAKVEAKEKQAKVASLPEQEYDKAVDESVSLSEK